MIRLPDPIGLSTHASAHTIVARDGVNQGFCEWASNHTTLCAVSGAIRDVGALWEVYGVGS